MNQGARGGGNVVTQPTGIPVGLGGAGVGGVRGNGWEYSLPVLSREVGREGGMDEMERRKRNFYATLGMNSL